MTWLDVSQRLIILSLSGFGIWGNVLIFVRHVHTFVLGPERKPLDLVLIHLSFSNTIIICNNGIEVVATVFSFRNFLGDSCKIVVYLARMAQRLSICTTCLLSVVQAVTISPTSALWRKLKPQTVWQVLPYLLLFWIFNSLISSNLLHYIAADRSMNSSEVGMFGGYCYLLPSGPMIKWLFLSLMAVHDVIFQSLMGCSSGSMALHLYKHHKRVLYLHSSRLANNSSPEIRATWSTVILMTGFLFFYWADFIISFYIGSTLVQNSIILPIVVFLLTGYAALSPFFLISRKGCVAKSCSAHG